MTTEEAKKLVTDNGGEIYVRQVSSMTRTLEVMPRMKKRYSFKKDYPSEFKFRCKCLILFQNLDGVDVILFVHVHPSHPNRCFPGLFVTPFLRYFPVNSHFDEVLNLGSSGFSYKIWIKLNS